MAASITPARARATAARTAPAALVALSASIVACSPPAVRSIDLVAETESRGAASLAVRPDEYLVVVEPSRAAVVGVNPAGERVWRFDLERGEHVIGPPAVAKNSYAYLRTQSRLLILDVAGKLIWQGRLLENVAEEAAGLALLPSSAVLFVSTPRQLLAMQPSGLPEWSFTLPIGDTFASAPQVGPKGKVTIMTHAALLQLNGDGTKQWYRLRTSVVEP